MKNLLTIFILISMISCAGDKTGSKAVKIAPGVYDQAGWIFDMKQLPSGEDIVPYFTVAKLSSNTIKANAADGSVVEMGVTVNFKISKSGSNEGKIVGGYFESTATNENEFKFPRCLSVCPVNIEIDDINGTIIESKTTYSRNNVFQMQLEDDVLYRFALEKKSLRVRIPVSVLNRNTTFEWFTLDLSNYNPKLNN